MFLKTARLEGEKFSREWGTSRLGEMEHSSTYSYNYLQFRNLFWLFSTKYPPEAAIFLYDLLGLASSPYESSTVCLSVRDKSSHTSLH